MRLPPLLAPVGAGPSSCAAAARERRPSWSWRAGRCSAAFAVLGAAFGQRGRHSATTRLPRCANGLGSTSRQRPKRPPPGHRRPRAPSPARIRATRAVAAPGARAAPQQHRPERDVLRRLAAAAAARPRGERRVPAALRGPRQPHGPRRPARELFKSAAGRARRAARKGSAGASRSRRASSRRRSRRTRPSRARVADRGLRARSWRRRGRRQAAATHHHQRRLRDTTTRSRRRRRRCKMWTTTTPRPSTMFMRPSSPRARGAGGPSRP